MMFQSIDLSKREVTELRTGFSGTNPNGSLYFNNPPSKLWLLNMKNWKTAKQIKSTIWCKRKLSLSQGERKQSRNKNVRKKSPKIRTVRKNQMMIQSWSTNSCTLILTQPNLIQPRTAVCCTTFCIRVRTACCTFSFCSFLLFGGYPVLRFFYRSLYINPFLHFFSLAKFLFALCT